MRIIHFIIVLLFFGTFYGCTLKNKKVQEEWILSEYSPEYAKGFRIYSMNNCYKLELISPWTNEIYHTYFIGDSVSVEDIDENTTILSRIPQKIGLLSSTHVAMVKELGMIDNVVLVDDRKYIYDSLLFSRIENDRVKEVGELQLIDIENVICIKPDLVFLTGWNQPDKNESILKKSGINLAYNLDWMEYSPLGRAEWIRFFGAMLGQDQRADSIFSIVKQKYLAMKENALSSSFKPSLLHGFHQKGIWYIPGGESYVGILYRDAGADYLWKNELNTGSIPMNIENVLEKGLGADIWIITSMTQHSINQLSDESMIKGIKAFKENKVYSNNKRAGETGGNDYWESGILHPDELLHDLILILQDQSKGDSLLKYYRKVNVEQL